VEPRARFETLYREHAGAVRAYARRRIDAAAADDVVAEAFLVAWRRLDEVPGEPLPWLLGVARRVLANKRRGEARAAALKDRVAATDPPPVIVEPPSGRLGDALQALGERDREALLLVAWEGLTSGQAAEVLGLRPGTFAVRLHRARRRLERLLDAREADDPEAVLEAS
jgi:RNA polymerase sigma-70 factor, ECF subfamily